MIQFFHVFKAYGEGGFALSDLTLHVRKGEYVFVTGPSGAGKSTLLRLIFCAEQPNRGQLLVNGRNVTRLDNAAIAMLRREIGVVFQDFKLLPKRTVEENISIPLEVAGVRRHICRRRAAVLLRQLGLAHKAKSLPPTLSGGEQQRVAIGRALVNQPKILVADEPTGNLDREHTRVIMNLIEEAHARGTTVVLATHDQSLLKSGRRVVALDAGQLVSVAA